MALRTLVKVGKISNLSDARYCAGMGVDMLGFSVVENQDQYVSPELFKEIRGWFSGPLVVAEAYGVDTLGSLNQIIQNYLPDLIELSVKEFNLISATPGKYILSGNAEELTNHKAQLEALKDKIEYLLVPAGINLAVLKNLTENFRILVYGNSFAEIEVLLESGLIAGVTLQGSSEEKPGFKSYDQLTEIFEKLEIED